MYDRAREAGRADEIRLRKAWARLAEAVLRHHHGGGPSPETTRVW
ncbi:hypothetical protein [Kitasatospora sp. NPDC001547]